MTSMINYQLKFYTVPEMVGIEQMILGTCEGSQVLNPQLLSTSLGGR
jgi:hypothetical protein